MDALKAGLDGTPVVLIQGPPGTGKTRTILNLLSVVMHRCVHTGCVHTVHSSHPLRARRAPTHFTQNALSPSVSIALPSRPHKCYTRCCHTRCCHTRFSHSRCCHTSC
eukprot:107396-Chlamydomonas_euryale.AAC.2